jgi:hypothetical protein
VSKFTRDVLKILGEVEIIALRLWSLVALLYAVSQLFARH